MKRKLMLLLACLFVGIGLVTAQTQKVTGVVISEEDGQPVVGASVLVKGTTQGTITDVDGNFNLSNIPSSAKDFADFVYRYANARGGNQTSIESNTKSRCTAA